MSSRLFKNLIFLLALILNVVVGATTFYFYKSFNILLFKKISIIILIISLTIIFSFLIYVFLFRKGIKNYILEQKIIFLLEKNLISINAYYKANDNNWIFYLPKIKLNLKDSYISIKTNNIKIRKNIENYEELLSSALPDDLVIKDYYINDSGTEFIIRFRDEKIDKQITYNTLNEYLKHTELANKLDFEVDNEHIVSLIDYPHFLISGSTGSGKSFLTQLLMFQFINKGFEVSIYDIKQSYLAFSDYVKEYETRPDEIVNKLLNVANEMRERQEKLSEHLKENPRALAIDYGYKQKIIIIEEYIGLKTYLSNDKEGKEKLKLLENTIKEISVLARSVNISLFIIAQSSSVDLIDSSIKNNLNKIFLGHLASNIQVSTFGNGVEVPLFTNIKKGYGYIQLNKIEQIKVPNVIYSIEELKLLKNNFCEHRAESPCSQTG